MRLDAVARQPADAGFGGRFYLVSYLPTYAAALFLLVLAWAGPPGGPGGLGTGLGSPPHGRWRPT